MPIADLHNSIRWFDDTSIKPGNVLLFRHEHMASQKSSAADDVAEAPAAWEAMWFDVGGEG